MHQLWTRQWKERLSRLKKKTGCSEKRAKYWAKYYLSNAEKASIMSLLCCCVFNCTKLCANDVNIKLDSPQAAQLSIFSKEESAVQAKPKGGIRAWPRFGSQHTRLSDKNFRRLCSEEHSIDREQVTGTPPPAPLKMSHTKSTNCSPTERKTSRLAAHESKFNFVETLTLTRINSLETCQELLVGRKDE